MSKSKLVALKPKFITPRIVVESILGDLEDLADLYCVGILKSDGSPIIWASGDLKSMAFASKALDVYVMKFIRGEIQ